MTSEDLKAIRYLLGNLENVIYDLDWEDDEEPDIDGALGSLRIVMEDVEELELKMEKEQKLRDANENLRKLYAEYIMVRDLIGSEKE